MLGEMYEVAGLREWLLSEGIDASNVMGAYEFGLVPEGVKRGGIATRCLSVAADRKVGEKVEQAGLRGVGREVIKKLALARAKQGKGQRLGWRYIRDAFNLLDGWVRANAGESGAGADDDVSWFRESVTKLDIGMMPLNVLREVVVEGSKYLDGGWVSSVLKKKQDSRSDEYAVEYKEGRRYDVGQCVISSHIALEKDGPGQRMALVKFEYVKILNVASGSVLATAGSKGRLPGKFKRISGVAFSGNGELYVSDLELHRISVFDRQGRHVRSFGSKGKGHGQFNSPRGLCFTAGGDLVVADTFNHRVQIFREDAMIRSIREGDMRVPIPFLLPHDVCATPDNNIAVLNYDERVVVISGNGALVRSFGSKGSGPGQFLNPFAITSGRGGEIIVSDRGRKDVQVFSAEGRLLQIIGPEGDTKVAWQKSGRADEEVLGGVVACADGRLFIYETSSVVLLSSSQSRGLYA